MSEAMRQSVQTAHTVQLYSVLCTVYRCTAVLLNGSLLYDYGRLSDCFVQNGRFLVAFLCERSFFVKIWKITKGGPLDKFSPKHKEISVFTSQS